MTLPLEHELHDALHRDLWLLAQAQETAPEGDPTDYVPPAHRYLPLLRDALSKLQEAHAAAKQEIPRSVLWKLTQETRKSADAVETMARHEPEVRRFWLLDTLLFVCDAGVRMLETEGKPAPDRLPDCTCGHNLSQHDMNHHNICLSCPCAAFTARGVLKAHPSPELAAKIEQDRQETSARFARAAFFSAAALKAALARQEARALQRRTEARGSTS